MTGQQLFKAEKKRVWSNQKIRVVFCCFNIERTKTHGNNKKEKKGERPLKANIQQEKWGLNLEKEWQCRP